MMMRRPRVLIIDDETNFVASLIYGLAAHGIEAHGAPNAAAGLAAVREHRPDTLLLDQRLPDGAGIDLIGPIHELDPKLRIIMISAHGDIPTAVEAVKRGAVDFVSKPFDLEDVVTVLRGAPTPGQIARPSTRTAEKATPQFVGVSPASEELRATIAVIARSSTRTILLLGPSGVGKSLAARAIHESSLRGKGPLTTINCASLPADLLEAELFGVERGAYTGAAQSRAGLVETADGGTLFLDEIGEMPINLQAKLLHLIESRSYRRVGSSREQTADVRIVAATNRDLRADVTVGRFRADLFYRLNVVPLALPGLRDRRDDIMPLARHFAERAAAYEGTAVLTFSEDAVAALMSYDWPGNARELANLIERLTILHPGVLVARAHLPPEIADRGSDGTSAIDTQLADTERNILQGALRAAHGHKGKAAELLGISRHALKRRLKRIGLL